MRQLWGALWHSKNNIDGLTQYLLSENCLPVLFKTRREARIWIEGRYGYIKSRSDLRKEPHGWRLPRAVKVSVGEEMG